MNTRKKQPAKQTKRSPVCLNNQQKKYRLPLARLRRQTSIALQLLAAEMPPQIEIIFVNQRCISELHQKFLNDPTPTDVITFHHGEIFICPEIAEKQRGTLSLHHEILTYIIHGLLHLYGWEDTSPKEFNAMRREQERILKKVLNSDKMG